MDIFDAAQGAITFALAVIPWLFPDSPWHGKVIAVLLIIVVSIFVYCIRLSRKLKAAELELNEVRKRHTALSVQFDEKTEREKRYRRAFQNLNLMLHLAGQNTKAAKFSDIYQAFLVAQNDINSGGMYDGENLQDR